MKIDTHKIGIGEKCFIIAEAGPNHNANVDNALKMIRAAADAGADAVKFQTFNTDLIIAKGTQKASYQKGNTNPTEDQYQMLKQLELPRDAYPLLLAECKKNKIIFMSTPFDNPSVDFLDDLGIKIYKIPSGEITNIPLLKYIAEKKKPLILSTGMATMPEIADAVNAIFKTGNKDLILLQCTSNYPADPADINLKAMLSIADKFSLPVGFSDHTLGIEIAMAAVALGACIIEKHFTLDRNLPGPDHKASLEPDKLKELISGIKNVEKALGSSEKKPAASERDTIQAARRSLVASTYIAKGSIITEKMINIKRPGTGMTPSQVNNIIGKTTKIDIPDDTLFKENMFK